MGPWDTVKAWLKGEATDLQAARDDLEQQIDADLSRRERQLDETPEEALERLQAEIAESDTEFEALGDEIGHLGSNDPDDLDRDQQP